ncbi:DUF3626 domain-containing protein [Actinoplanes sp. DH11]|uniref:DUF3626 domain-containing protein n=1 Tax=Actinoplanes sp. DH11 TaxID=2857011 RepID=UPI001E54FCC2|nr:DUF3626 domain-containing protein [Actinoplanes sp. DH11]
MTAHDPHMPERHALAHVRALGAPGPVPDAPITVNFHPDRPLADGRTVAECLAADGVYRSQFETRISSGALIAYPGGDRDHWEHRMFGGAYTGVAGRPIYGALNLAGHPDGAAPRFGSCHLVLHRAVSQRATFCLGDSHRQPDLVGTADAFATIWAELLDQVPRFGGALGVPATDAGAWAAILAARRAGSATEPGRTLDDYVEAQVHGGLTLRHHVEAVVADPCFRGTPTETHLHAMGVPVRWHAGFTLPAAEFPVLLRGPDTPALAKELADRYRRPVLDAEVLGRAARDGADTQLVKYLWHILVLLGRRPGVHRPAAVDTSA